MRNDSTSQYQTTIAAPVEKVWGALINAELVKQYFFGSTQETHWKIGSPIVWTGEYNGIKYMDKGIMKEFVQNKTLSYAYLSSWSKLEDREETTYS